MGGITVQQAIDCLGQALCDAASGLERPPEVDFRVDWIDCSTVTETKWVPHLTLHVETRRTIRVEDM